MGRFFTTARITLLTTILAVISLPYPIEAYNYAEVDDNGNPIGWESGSTIVYYLDPGDYGYLTNEQAHALLKEATKRWEDVSVEVPHFEFGGYLTEDVKGDNYQTYVATRVCYTDNLDDCSTDYQKELKSVIVFDENDEITTVECRWGGCSALAGRGVYDGNANTRKTIKQGYIIMGRSVLGYELRDVFGVFVHEIGHVLGLAHPYLNQQITSNDLIRDTSIYMPTMSTGARYRGNLNPDDLAGISSLYPNSSFSTNTASISGTVSKSDGSPLTHVNVIARDVENPYCKTYSFITGRTCPYSSVETCEIAGKTSGAFMIQGLPPGTYTIEVEGYSDDDGAMGVAPGIYDSPVITGNAEFWNENDAVDEDPLTNSTITLRGGDSIDGIDITLDDSVANNDSALYIPADFLEVTDNSECVEDDADYYELTGIERPISNSETFSPAGGCSLVVR